MTTKHVNPDDIRMLFSRAMSDMYGAEVPQYDVLLELISDFNDQTLRRDPDLKARPIARRSWDYFPSKSLRREFLQPSDTHTICPWKPWKGKAHYYTLLVDGKENAEAAWYYPDPKPAAQKIACLLERRSDRDLI